MTVYKVSSNLTFGQAIERLQEGKRVARTGWNGKNMFIWLKPEATIKAEFCQDPILKKIAEDNGGTITGLPTVCMKTADNKILTGWAGNQMDMLSNDWYVVE